MKWPINQKNARCLREMWCRGGENLGLWGYLTNMFVTDGECEMMALLCLFTRIPLETKTASERKTFFVGSKKSDQNEDQ